MKLNALSYFKKALKIFTAKNLNSRIFFLHIAKCGGTSITDAISGCFSRYESRDQSHLDAEAAVNACRLLGMNWKKLNEQILLYELGRSNVRYVAGHYFYSQTAFDAFSKEWNFITLLRNPVDRWISEYYFNRFNANKQYHTGLNLKEYLCSEKGNSSGGIYATLLEGNADNWAQNPKQCVQDAITNLRRFKLVGCLEHLDLFKAGFKNLFGIDLSIKTRRSSPAPSGLRQAEITPEIKKQVEHICRYDMEIYKYAVTHLSPRDIAPAT